MGVDGPPARMFLRFLRFLSLTTFQAEGCGIALSVHSEHILHYANWICKGASATRKSSESVTAEDEGALATRKM